ncbi:hypothetical protein [Geminocystis herdmanii]|uniref:hypothetical protein n=1 Tax=Geminocystis herdmanii TaxID=669359 RepID=UPI0003457CA6|nr:hypothetical protein [Geminocystis herdmanii]
MIDLSYFSLGVLLWLGSCGFLITLRREDKSFLEGKKSQSQEILSLDSGKIKELEMQLQMKTADLILATKKIEALETQLQITIDRLEYNEDEYLKSQQQSEIQVTNLEKQIETLEKKCLALNEEIETLPPQLIKDWQKKSFELLQTLLANYPTAKVMVKLKPDFPAKNLIPLLAPLDKILSKWEIESIGKPWEKVSYNPLIHYTDEENLTPNEKVYIRFVGYSQKGKILLPAKVNRTLPGQNKN